VKLQSRENENSPVDVPVAVSDGDYDTGHGRISPWFFMRAMAYRKTGMTISATVP
jgi:hypothetical protein